MAGKSKVKGRKGKLGKKKHWIAAYFNEQRHRKNKLRRVLKHLKRYGGPNQDSDKVALKCVAVQRAALPLRYAA